MPVFFSYSHENADFVDALAAQLIQNRVGVWIDRWELRVGDSITPRIQDAITQASALLVVLSKASVASDWCKREINAGLFREMEEKRVVVLPLLLETCDVPLFLKDKMYADFRTDRDKGLRDVLKAIAPISNSTQNRIDTPDFHTDWAYDWFSMGKDGFGMRLVAVEHGESIKHCVMSELEIEANITLSKKMKALKGKPEDERRLRRDIFAGIASSLGEGGKGLVFLLVDQFQQRRKCIVNIEGYGQVELRAFCRWLGENHGNDVLYRMGNNVQNMVRQMDAVDFNGKETPQWPKAASTPWVQY